MIGAGSAGREAARRHTAEGRNVVVIEADPARADSGEGFEVVNGTALGVLEGGLVPVDAGALLLRYRASWHRGRGRRCRAAADLPGNDLVGVMPPEAVRRPAGRWSLMPGSCAVVIAVDEAALDTAGLLEQAGTQVSEVVDLREQRIRQIAGKWQAGRLEAVELDGCKVGCDLLAASGGRQPCMRSSRTQAERWSTTTTAGSSCQDFPTGSRSSARGAGRRRHGSPCDVQRRREEGKCFVCICEGRIDKDVKRAIAEGFD